MIMGVFCFEREWQNSAIVLNLSNFGIVSFLFITLWHWESRFFGSGQ